MNGGHLTDALLLAYLDGELEQEQRTFVRVHLEACDLCSQARASLSAMMNAQPVHVADLPAPGDAVDRVHDLATRARRKVEEELAATEAIGQLRDLPVSAWRTWLRFRRNLHTAGMTNALVAEARAHVQEDPESALAIVTVATRIASALMDRIDGPVARATVANERATALRMRGDYPGALAALDAAHASLDELRFAPDEKAHVSWNRAIVLYALQRYAEAREALEEPRNWFRAVGACIELARVLILEASILYAEDDAARAFALFSDAARVLENEDLSADLPRVYAGLAFCHLALGELSDAHALARRTLAGFAAHEPRVAAAEPHLRT